MIPVTRKLLAVLVVATVLAPAGVALCAAASARACAGSEHSCCETPRLAQCDCGTSHVPGEAAGQQQSVRPGVASHSVPGFAALATLPIVDAARSMFVRPPPPRDVGERLSLLATLLV